MPHISPETLEALFQRDPDVTMCVHGLQTRILTPDTAVVRLAGHLALSGAPEEGDQDLPAEYCLVVDIPMSSATVALASAHMDETMGQMVDSALEAITTEDGET